MNRIIALIAISAILVFASCKNANQKNADEAKADSTQAAVTEQITETLTDTKGNELQLTFDNTNETLQAVFNHEAVSLKQEPTASGIIYKNDQYNFTQWQGITELLKDGRSLFSNYKGDGEVVEKWYKSSENLSLKAIYADIKGVKSALVSFDFQPLLFLEMDEKAKAFVDGDFKWSVDGNKGKLIVKGKSYNFIEETVK